VRGRGEAKVLIFDLVPFAEAQAQFEHSSKVVELMATRCLRLHLGIGGLVFDLVRAATLPLNLAEACPNRLVSSVTGDLTSLCAIPF
jgi:hypothetical protein